MNATTTVRSRAAPRIRRALGVALLGACAACQQVPVAPIDPAANGARIASRSLTDSAVQAALQRHELGVAPDNAWSLDHLTLAAWTLRTDLAVARKELDAARATTVVESQRPNPSVTTTTENVVDDGAQHPWVVGAALAFSLELGGKRDIRRDRALAQEQVLEWQFGETLWAARAEVRAALLELAFAERAAALDDTEAGLARQFLSWVDTRFEHGAATTSERLAALQSLNESTSRRELDKAAVATASATLAAAVGVTPGELAGVRTVVPPLEELRALPATDVNTARDLALVNRLDVRRALAEYGVAEQDLRAAVATQYPDIKLAPGYLLDQADHKITLGLDVPVPLFHGADAAIDRAIAERALAAAKFDDVQARALAAIDVGLARYESSRNALAAAEAAERDATEAAASLERRLEAGGANRGEVLAAQIALAGLRRSSLTARRAVLDAATELENGIERPLFPASALETTAAIPELLVGGSR
jgi:outer membrane protein TolC